VVAPRGAAASALLLLLLAAAPAAAEPPFTLTFLGDIMGHDVNYRMADYRDIYRGVQDLFLADDLTVANLELPVDPALPEAGFPRFNGSLAYVRAAVDSGVDAFSLANNHAFDGGVEGVFQTLRAMRTLQAGVQRSLAFSGTRGNPLGRFMPHGLVVRGVRVGFLAAAQALNEPDRGRYVYTADYDDPAQAAGLLQLVRDTSPLFDLYVVSYHGDLEYVQEPSPRKRAFFRSLAEAGAHIVFGHHPHVIQGYEVVRAAGSDRLIMYSMGNFISGMTWRLDPAGAGLREETGEAFLLRAEFGPAGPRSWAVERVQPVPTANYRNDRGEMVVGKLGELAAGAMGLSPAWTAYYAKRLTLMEEFLAGFAPATRAAPLRP
jgi:hypothetical protein